MSKASGLGRQASGLFHPWPRCLIIVEFRIDDLQLLTLADGGDECLEDGRIDVGVDVGVPDGNAGGESVVVDTEPCYLNVDELLEIGEDRGIDGRVLQGFDGA